MYRADELRCLTQRFVRRFGALVALTARGACLAAEVERASRARFRALLTAVPAAQRAHVVDGLRHLVAAVDRLTDHPTDETDARRTLA